jgi:hypothetical protein
MITGRVDRLQRLVAELDHRLDDLYEPGLNSRETSIIRNEIVNIVINIQRVANTILEFDLPDADNNEHP